MRVRTPSVGSAGRSLFALHPNVAAIARAPVLYPVHAAAAWAIFIVWPFSRLVHAWSYPLWYLWRPCIVVRSRVARPPEEPGTGGRKWRKSVSPIDFRATVSFSLPRRIRLASMLRR
ncbi:respiratory nitrate reductase subunit gamma [Mycobacterium sp.]|uniref:respiratory nitrate reductase subunit gamma n=1 Tax=Mycobacterium sp. TaxID=1785 RepID=UPI0025DEA596|nr:respiratory nitrate reductase subunit gamma [Mycobacterium sp.]